MDRVLRREHGLRLAHVVVGIQRRAQRDRDDLELAEVGRRGFIGLVLADEAEQATVVLRGRGGRAVRGGGRGVGGRGVLAAAGEQQRGEDGGGNERSRRHADSGCHWRAVRG